MNIFILDRNPIVAAELMCDKHVVKMIVESAQMLSTTHRMLDGALEERLSVSGKRKVKYYKLNDWREDTMYKAVHFNHPCNVWLRQSLQNYNWLVRHFGALLREYTVRYNKLHKCSSLWECFTVSPDNIKKGPLTEFAQAMPDECKNSDAVQAYRTYYNKYKKDFATWKVRQIPEWFV